MKYIRRFNESNPFEKHDTDHVELVKDYFLDIIEGAFPSKYVGEAKPTCKVLGLADYIIVVVSCLRDDRQAMEIKLEAVKQKLKNNYIISLYNESKSLLAEPVMYGYEIFLLPKNDKYLNDEVYPTI